MTVFFNLKNPHLKAAEEAIAYVKKTVVYSANFADRNGILKNNTPNDDLGTLDYDLFKSRIDAIDEQIGTIREKGDKRFEEELNPFLDSLPKSIKDKFSSDLLHNFLDTAVQSHYAETYSIGNCGELSAVAFMHLVKANRDCPVELFFLADKKNLKYNHSFLVLGRDQKSDPNVPKKWNAVICDLWARDFYSSSDFAKRMCNYEGCQNGNFYKPRLRKYDPKMHDLKLHAVNIFSKGLPGK